LEIEPPSASEIGGSTSISRPQGSLFRKAYFSIAVFREAYLSVAVSRAAVFLSNLFFAASGFAWHGGNRRFLSLVSSIWPACRR